MAAFNIILRDSLALGVLALFLLAQGCLTHPVEPEPQPVVVPPEGYSVTLDGAAIGEGPWWAVFDDAALTNLIQEALDGNLTLAQAHERIERADLLLRQARSLAKPQADLGAGASRSYAWRYEKGIDGPSALDQAESVLSDLESIIALTQGQPVPGGADRVEVDRTSTDYSTDLGSGLTVGWELDFWGRLGSEARARGEAYVSAVLDLEALRLSLSGEVAEAYYQALEQRLQHALLLEQQASATTTLELLELRFLQGAASSVDVLQQRGQLAAIESELPVVKARLRLLENRLDALLGRPPDGLDRTPDRGARLPEPGALPAVGVPLALLQNRPDLRALQRRVVAADHRVAAAMAERYPRITLGVSMDYGDSSDAATFTANAAAGLLQPVWDWGRRRAAVDASASLFQESLLAYSEAFLFALEDVENTLWQEATQRELVDSLVRQERILRETVQETRVRYSLGVTDYLPVLTAEQSLRGVQRELLRQRRVQVSLRIQLCRAIGGPTGSRAALTAAGAAPYTPNAPAGRLPR